MTPMGVQTTDETAVLRREGSKPTMDFPSW
jgi:hypothetical protein